LCILYYVYHYIKKSPPRCERNVYDATGDGETDISIAKGFDNQKGPVAAVTARRIRSFRHANLWTRRRRRRRDDNIAAPAADCRVSDADGGEEPYGNCRAGKVVKNDTIYIIIYYIPYCILYLYTYIYNYRSKDL